MGSDVITFGDFQKIDIRVGTILKADLFPEVRNPAYKLEIDFGTLGVLKSSAQITTIYDVAELVGRQVIAVVNFPPKQIATMMSACLVLGAVSESGEVTLLQPERLVTNGDKIG